MDVLLLSRLQFALTIGFHFIFPPVSIGLAWMLVLFEYKGWRKNDMDFVRISRFFARILAITFALGVATGITMEFQFGTNWAEYSKFVGDIFGAPLAAEGIFAFFLESCFLGLYLFGRNRVSKGIHWFSILMVALGSTISAFWIIVANSWQQTPTGFVLRNGRAELTSFMDAVFNPSTVIRFLHTVDAALITGAFVVAGICAYLILKNRGGNAVVRTGKIAVISGLVVSVLEIVPFGDGHAKQVAATQPEKFAAIEGLYVSQNSAPLLVFGIPASDPPEIKMKIEIPGALSYMAFGDFNARVRGIDEFPPDEIPPLKLTFIAFHSMVALGGAFVLICLYGVFLIYRKKFEKTRWFLKVLVWSTPLPIVACQLGWIAAEVGRQPWIVYKLLRTSAAFSPVLSAGEVWFSIILFGLIYMLLGFVYIYLVFRKVKHGPEPANTQEVMS
jgi:cytochrome d ubiquinol oxidase subunit I